MLKRTHLNDGPNCAPTCGHARDATGKSEHPRPRHTYDDRPRDRRDVHSLLRLHGIREMGGAPRNPAPRNHFFVRIVKPAGCHCTDAFGEKKYRRVPTPLRSTSPFSDGSARDGRGEGQRAAATPEPRGARRLAAIIAPIAFSMYAYDILYLYTCTYYMYI